MIDKTSWTEEDIKNLIVNQVKENINLDYKASASLARMNDSCKKELSKDVSAFANSDGGILVYGVVEIGNIPIRIDDGFDPNVVTREWIEQVIDSNIKRKVDGIRIYQVDLSGEKSGRVVYVISIPQSTDAPHMANDNRYYKKYNFKSNPMEDYEVRDVRRRHAYPNLKVKFVVDYKEKKIEVFIYNTSQVTAEYYGVRLYIDSRIEVINNGGFILGKNNEFIINEHQKFSAMCLINNFIYPKAMPIWEGEEFLLSTIKFDHPISEEMLLYYMGWRVSGPGFNNTGFMGFEF
jgi:predicted HTH transcriptional regulator